MSPDPEKMDPKEVTEFAADLRKLSHWLDDQVQAGNDIPHFSMYFDLQFYLTESDYVKDPETEQWKSFFNEDATKINLKRFLKIVGSCDKEYREDQLRIHKEIGTSGR